MGNDGGTIARGKDLRAIYSADSGTQDQQYLQKSHNSKVVTCCLSSLPLYQSGVQKVVSDYQGKVYLKEKVLEYMVKKIQSQSQSQSQSPSQEDRFDHLKRLSDIVDLHVTWKDGMAVCPITGTSSGLIYFRPCGCVVSGKMAGEFLPKKAIARTSGCPNDESRTPKEASSRACPRCGRDALDLDMVHLNPPRGSDLEAQNEENYILLVLKGMTHSKTLKKGKKGKKEKEKMKVRKTEKENTEKAKKAENGGEEEKAENGEKAEKRGKTEENPSKRRKAES